MIFFLSCIGKFTHGGWFAILVAALIFLVMESWRRGSIVEYRQRRIVHLKQYLGKLEALRNDKSIPRCATNLVYLNHTHKLDIIDGDVLYSILDNEPKRANAYWFVNFIVTSKPNGCTYKVDSYGTDFAYRVSIKLGYKEDQRVNIYLDQIIKDLEKTGEYKVHIPTHSAFDTTDAKKYHRNMSTYVGNFKYCLIFKMLSSESDISPIDRMFVQAKYRIRKVAGTPDRWYGLENSAVISETVPLFLRRKKNKKKIIRVK